MPNEFPQDIAALNAIEDRAAEIKALMPTALHGDGGLKVHVQNGGDVGGGGEAIAMPENEEVVALASGIDDAGGRTSADIENKYGRGAYILVDCTAKTGESGSPGTLTIEAKIGGVYKAIQVFGNSLPVEAGQALFAVSLPLMNSSEITTTSIALAMPRTYRIVVTTDTDAENTLTYSVTVIHLL